MTNKAECLPRIIVVTGPTASGKSALAVVLGKELEAEIVNCDSVQLYRETSIGSARVSAREEEGVPHHLFDVLSPPEAFDAARFVEAARRCIAEIQGRGKIVIVTGGPGLYLTSLLHGIAELPKRDTKLREELDARSSEDLYRELNERDPSRARQLHEHDRVRVVRALEAAIRSSSAPSALHAAHEYRERNYQALLLAICHPRHILHERIAARTQKMIERGLLHEVDALLKRYGSGCHVLRSIGFKEAAAALRGELAEEMLVQRIIETTRQLAKRQMTYLRNEPPKRGWVVRPEQRGTAHSVKSFDALAYGVPELCEGVREWLARDGTKNEIWYITG